MSLQLIDPECIAIHEQEYTVVRRLDDGFYELQEKVSQHTWVISQREVIKLLQQGHLTLFGKRNHLPEDQENLVSRMLNLSHDDFFIMDVATRVVRVILALGHSVTNAARLEAGNNEWFKAYQKDPEAMKRCFKGQRDKKTDYKTFRRWIKKYLLSGKNSASLLPRHDCKGNRTRRVCPEALNYIHLVIELARRDKKTWKITQIQKKVREFIQADNEKQPKSLRLDYPSYDVINHEVKALTAYERAFISEGPEAVREDFRCILEQRIGEQALAYVEIDHTPLDIIIVDKAGNPIQRPYLTACICRNTGAILGFYIGLEPPSYLTASLALKLAMLPKPLSDEPGAKEWLMYGVPVILVVDNGAEFHSESFKRLTQAFGIDVRRCPRKTGWLKGAIERWFRTSNDQLIHTLRGTTLSNPNMRGEYDSKKHACITLDGLRRIFSYWVTNVYHQQYHRSLGTSPAARWAERMLIDHVKKVPDPDNLEPLLGDTQTDRALSHTGVNFANMHYNSPELNAMFREVGKTKVDFRYNALDLGRVWVIHPQTGEPIVANCSRPDYGPGMSLYLHKFLRDNAPRKGSSASIDELVRAYRHIADMELDEYNKTQTQRRMNARAARVAKDAKAAQKAQSTLAEGPAPNPPASDTETVRFQPTVRERGAYEIIGQ
ncbi:Mu transposase C-terminal domain-containing protein [Motiliproteus sediminis]|uniref:Mu transposase C-terminal domain-containing protein n=1 Tax=Motiliproteus sediminis TaxID=1468178 RepID=UPI001AEF460A|nr:Mu transposase C-terminal domain-containing protein [Motiliproteus sediminis]